MTTAGFVLVKQLYIITRLVKETPHICVVRLFCIATNLGGVVWLSVW